MIADNFLTHKGFSILTVIYASCDHLLTGSDWHDVNKEQKGQVPLAILNKPQVSEMGEFYLPKYKGHM